MVDALEPAVLLAVEHLTRGTYGQGVEETDLSAELERMGQLPPDGIPYRLITGLKKDGYIEAMLLGGMRWGAVELTRTGKATVGSLDPFECVDREARRGIASDQFAANYPSAFDLWAESEQLLWAEDSASHLTTIGHKIREATQAFATAMVEAHQPPNVDAEKTHVEKRLGAVIAMHMEKLPNSHRLILEGLGNLWESANDLIQRQEHGAQKEGEEVTWDDARRTVFLSMFLMIEFAVVFEGAPARVAVLEPAGRQPFRTT